MVTKLHSILNPYVRDDFKVDVEYLVLIIITYLIYKNILRPRHFRIRNNIKISSVKRPKRYIILYKDS